MCHFTARILYPYYTQLFDEIPICFVVRATRFLFFIFIFLLFFPGIPVHFSGIQIYVYKIEFIYTQTECDCVRTWLKENLLFELGIIKMECYIYFGRTPWKIKRESKKCELMAMVPSSRIHFNARVRELWNLMKDSFILAVVPVQIT